MSETNQFTLDYKTLQQLEAHMKQLGFQTALHDVSSEVPVPMMTMALDEDEQGEALIVSMGFTPFLSDMMEKTRVLQLSVQLNLKVTQRNRADLLELSNLVNGIIPIGHFTILEDQLCYRYACPLSTNARVTDQTNLEAFSFYFLMAMNHNSLFAKLAAGVVTLEEAERQFSESLR